MPTRASPRRVKELAWDRLGSALQIKDKKKRYAEVADAEHRDASRALVAEGKLTPATGADGKAFDAAFGKLHKKWARGHTLSTRKRIDGRNPDEIRAITIETGVLPRAHGSALFTRGETQALVAVTLGTKYDEKKLDTLLGDKKRTFYMDYNFPPFSTGEVKMLRGQSRREVGHGFLAERSVEAVVPVYEDFPYTIRVVSDILESNGSSSMASVCGGSLALMDAGVPTKAPVAGIAMGLMKEGDDYVILSDILGDEDHLGDMDFKVTGTRRGVCALQMDIKVDGLTRKILEEALEQAKRGRIHIIEKMDAAMSAPRDEVSIYAPRIVTVQVKPDKVRDIIGPGGKTIRAIQEQTGAQIDINDSGIVSIASSDSKAIEQAQALISGLTMEPEVGLFYNGIVKKIVEIGAFVEILPGTDGLLHISEVVEGSHPRRRGRPHRGRRGRREVHQGRSRRQDPPVAPGSARREPGPRRDSQLRDLVLRGRRRRDGADVQMALIDHLLGVVPDGVARDPGRSWIVAFSHLVDAAPTGAHPRGAASVHRVDRHHRDAAA